MFIDLEPLEKLYKQILQTQALSEKELKELETLIKKLNETKEEIENSSFSILEKNTELFSESNTILQKIIKLSNSLENLENSLKKEKITFNSEIKQKFNSLLQTLKNNINSFNLDFMNEKSKIEKNTKEIVKNVENALKDTKKVILRENDELDKVRKQYEKKLENSLNSFKEKIDEYEDEIRQKTLWQRWGAVAGAFAMGVAVSLIFLVPTIKAKLKADKIVQVVKIEDPKAKEIIAKLNEKIAKLQDENEKLRDEIEYLSEYKIPDSWRFTCDTKTNPHNCIGVPAKFVEEDYHNDEEYYFIHLPKNRK